MLIIEILNTGGEAGGSHPSELHETPSQMCHIAEQHFLRMLKKGKAFEDSFVHTLLHTPKSVRILTDCLLLLFSLNMSH